MPDDESVANFSGRAMLALTDPQLQIVMATAAAVLPSD
jgi:hypothetical protein